MRTVIFHLCICILVQSVSVFSLAVFLWALLPEIKWMMMDDDKCTFNVAIKPIITFAIRL